MTTLRLRRWTHRLPAAFLAWDIDRKGMFWLRLIVEPRFVALIKFHPDSDMGKSIFQIGKPRDGGRVD